MTLGGRALLGSGLWLATGCAHPDNLGPETSTGGEGRPCMLVGEAGPGSGSSTGDVTSDAELAGTFFWTMVPGIATEIDVELGADAWMGAVFEATGTALHWDVHSHVGGDVIVHDSGQHIAGLAELDAPGPGLYSFFWRNPGPADASLCVEVRLRGDARLHDG